MVLYYILFRHLPKLTTTGSLNLCIPLVYDFNFVTLQFPTGASWSQQRNWCWRARELPTTLQIFFLHVTMPKSLFILSSLYFLQSSVCAKIIQLLGQNEVDHQKWVVILSQDSFYRVLTTEQKAKALIGHFNFDHPGNLSQIDKGMDNHRHILSFICSRRLGRLKCYNAIISFLKIQICWEVTQPWKAAT